MADLRRNSFTANRSLSHGTNTNQRGSAKQTYVDVTLSRMRDVSTKGQWFGRFAPRQSGKGHESVGTNGTHDSCWGGPREVQFGGRPIIVTGAGQGGISRRTTIEFNEGFTVCDAHIISAKEADRDVFVGNNLVTEAADKEIHSVTVSNVSYSVRDGNVFAQ
jgi:hypothetical protein